jgi:nucleoside-diphosphate-sugar epimerase
VTALEGAGIVVTGSAGFIGTELVRTLARAGADVTGLDRRAPAPGAPGTHLRVDLNDPGVTATLRELLDRADMVFHLAARPGVRGGGPDIERERQRDNVDAGRVVLALTPRTTPLVVTSSSSVYGGARVEGAGVRASRETDPLRPLGGYARSKAALEVLCAARVEAGGMVAVARPFTVAGEGQRLDMALARWLDAAAAGRPIEVLGDTARCRDVTDVRDVVRGLVALGLRGASTVVNLGTGRSRSLRELVDAVAEVVARPVTVVVRPAGSEEPPATRAHTDRCHAACGFVPETDLLAVVRRQWQRCVAVAA